MAEEYAGLTVTLNLIFWPFLRLALLFWAGYGLLDGALLHWLPGFDPPANCWQLLGPGMLAAALLLWLLWPRLRLLETGKKDNSPLLLSITAVATMAFGTNYLHDYLRVALGRFETLDSPAVLRRPPLRSTFYCFRHQYSAAHYAGVEWQAHLVNNGRNLVLHLYVATPLLASPADTVLPATSWLALHYSTKISARVSEADKQAAYQAFLRHTATQFGKEDFAAPAGYYARMPNTDERAAYLRAARRARLPLSATPILLIAGKVSLATRKQKALYYLACWLGGGTTVFFIILLISRLPAASAQAFRARHR